MNERFIDRALTAAICVAIVLNTSCHNSSKAPKESSKEAVKPDTTIVSKNVVQEKDQSDRFNFPSPNRESISFKQQKIQLKDTSFYLTLPKNWSIKVAEEGFGRLRFLTKSPDQRLFVTDMKNRTDNSEGKVLILDGFSKETATFSTQKTYLENLRNPNNIAFHKDSTRENWLYPR